MKIGDKILVTYSNGDQFAGRIYGETAKSWKVEFDDGDQRTIRKTMTIEVVDDPTPVEEVVETPVEEVVEEPVVTEPRQPTQYTPSKKLKRTNLIILAVVVLIVVAVGIFVVKSVGIF